MPGTAREVLDDLLRRRILVLDGAMGTVIQQRGLTEADYRGTKFPGHGRNLYGNHDLLSLSRPDLVSRIHHAYLDAGADIIKTNTFRASAPAQTRYGLESLAYELNRTSAELAVAASREWTTRTPEKPRFVAGSIGPSQSRLSSSDRGNLPVILPSTADELGEAFKDQVRGLLDGGCDVLMIETIVELPAARAALDAIQTLIDGRRDGPPVMLSVTLGRGSHRLAGGQTLEAFWAAVADVRPFAVGINCSYGVRHLKPALSNLAGVANTWVSCHPSAGLPDASGTYGELPGDSARFFRDAAQEGLVNIAGGCCGTTPEHIRAIAEAVKDVPPRRLPAIGHV